MDFLQNRNHQGALVGTIIFVIGLILFFLFAKLTFPDPPIEEEVVEIMWEDEFGMESAGGGDSSTEEVESAEEVEEEVVEEVVEEVTESQAEEVIETDTESEVEHESGNETTEPTVDDDRLFPGGFGGSGQSTEEGGGGQSGGGGGDGPVTGPGSGSIGDGEWSLAGRALVGKPSMNASTQETGTVVINIWVDRDGKVTRTSPNLLLSSTNSSELFDIAEKAAKKAKFNENSSAAVEQKGTMTFHFITN